MTFDKIFDLTAGMYFYFYNILYPTLILRRMRAQTTVEGTNASPKKGTPFSPVKVVRLNSSSIPRDQGYGRGGTPIFTGVFEPLARVALYPTDEDGLGTWFAAA